MTTNEPYKSNWERITKILLGIWGVLMISLVVISCVGLFNILMAGTVNPPTTNTLPFLEGFDAQSATFTKASVVWEWDAARKKVLGNPMLSVNFGDHEIGYRSDGIVVWRVPPESKP
jgi:hypothetical protein